MRQRNTFKLLGVIVAILVMSVGYAAIEDVTLTVTGNTIATPDQSNFKVKFTGTPTYSGTGTATLAITDDLKATMNVSGLTAAGDTLTASFTVANESTDITAYLSHAVTNTNTEYFEVTSSLGATELAPQTGTTTLNITVKLIKTLVTGDQTDTVTVEVIASPTKPPISFTIAGTTYYAEEGMTWEEWCDSSYNVDGFYVDEHGVTDGSSRIYGDIDATEDVLGSDLINANHEYWCI